MAASLAQIVAVEEGVRAATERWWRLVSGELAKAQLLVGHDYRYEPFEGNLPQPPDTRKIQIVTSDLLTEAIGKLTRFYDVSATRDWANTGARVDIAVDGQTVLPDVPTTFLLFLEKSLASLLADIRKLPAQDPAQDWSASTQPGVWRTAAVKRPATKKEIEHKVIVAPEGMRLAQIAEVPHDVQAGEWSRVEMTSALPASRLREITDRLTALIEAVKMARIDANKIDAPDVHVGRAIFGFIFGGEQ